MIYDGFSPVWLSLNTLRRRQNEHHLADDMFKCIFLNENVWIPIEISLKFVPKGSIKNNPALFQIMAWRRTGDKPLSEQMMVSSLTHICVTRPQWVDKCIYNIKFPDCHLFQARESDYIHRKQWDVFPYPCPKYKGALDKPPLNIWDAYVIKSHKK